MKKMIYKLAVAVIAGVAVHGGFAAEAKSGANVPGKPKGVDGQIIVFDEAKGPIRCMHAVNGAPREEGSENFTAWKSAEIPFARTHDLDLAPRFGSPHSFNVNWIFPNFDADENDERNYDFPVTDEIIDRMMKSGSKPFYRLGGMYEGWIKKRYTTIPPKDAAKWARICEHIIAHYTEGWANGRKYDIVYWEIWNEPNLSLFWTGSLDEFVNLMQVSVKHLKARFPKLRIGGPALGGFDANWTKEILKKFKETGTPLDFFSWHAYDTRPERFASYASSVRKFLDDYGFVKTESIFNEWNYVKDFDTNYAYSIEVENSGVSGKGSAFIAQSMSRLQSAPVDMAMFYCAWGAVMDSLFDNLTGLPKKGYYPFVAWSRLYRLGTEYKATGDLADVTVTAAGDRNGKRAVLITRYNEDNNITANVRVIVRLASGESLGGVRCLLTDDYRTFTDTGFEKNTDGSIELVLRPNSFAFLEW